MLRCRKRSCLNDTGSKMFQTLIKKLNCLFSAMACAEAGDLDTVKDILRQKDEPAQSARRPAAEGELADAS